MPLIDIVKIKFLCREEKLLAYISDGAILLKDTESGEVVRIGDATAIDPERRGRWDDSFDGITPHCSVCGQTHRCLNRTPDYCPSCGAKMGGDSDA